MQRKGFWHDYGSLNNSLVQFQTSIIDLESGDINDYTGEKKSGNQRIRTSRFVSISNIYSFTIPDGYDVWVYRFTSGKTYIDGTGWISGEVKVADSITDNTKYIYLLFRNRETPSADISSEVDTVESGLVVNLLTPHNISDLREDISETTRNLLDMRVFSRNGIEATDKYVRGTATAFNQKFANGVDNLGITFKPNTRYTLSLVATNEGDIKTGTGLSFVFNYTDGTNSIANLTNDLTKTHTSRASEANKTISKISITYYSGGSNVWLLEDMQIEEATVYTPYIPHFSATDEIARIMADTFSGMKIAPQWVRGYRDSSNGGRPYPNTDQMNRYVTTYDPIYLYEGSNIFCDTENLYRYSLIKYSDEQGLAVNKHTDGVLGQNKTTVNERGYYGINIYRYDNGTIDIDDFNSHVTMNLYSNAKAQIYSIFVGGGKEQFQAPGDSSLIIGETGKIVLIDGALANTQGQLWTCMAQNGIQEPNYIIISHMHSDHIGGLVRLLANNLFTLDNKTIFLPSKAGIDYSIQVGSLDQTSISWYEQLMEYINNATNLTVIRPSLEFEEYYIDGMTFKFWNVDHSVYINLDDRNYNDFSLCCNIEYGNQRLCFSGDIGPIAMGLNAGKNYKCNVYKVQHHGWDNITAEADVLNLKKWMSTVFPEIAISEDGITHDTLLEGDAAPMPDWCESNGVPFYRTNQNGFIYVRVSRDSFDILTPVIRWTKAENAPSN